MRSGRDVNPSSTMRTPLPALDRDRLCDALRGGCLIGRSIQIFAETASTNDLAREAGEAGAAEGLVFFAETQRAGRGRRGRAWSSPAGRGLWFSVLLRPRAPRDRWPRLTLLAARALIESLAELGVSANWKWPNDVVVGAGKLAGILVEATSQFAVLGIGLNVRQRPDDFSDEWRARALSVEMITGSGIEREALAAAILSQLDRLYAIDWAGREFVETLQYCVDRAALQAGRAVRVFAGDRWIDGTLLGYTDEAHLRLKHAGHEQVVREGLLEEAKSGS
jgi:BirA family transcriptional regulator, biotin operon repressor / biotin---[acetyl-CoA-carboxylase] ligase